MTIDYFFMNEDFRKKPPAPLAPKPFSIPKPTETVLANGLKVIVFEDKKLPLVSFRLAFKFGEINDDLRGLTSMTSAMLKEGTTTHTSKQLAEAIDKIGASLYAASSSDNTIVSASSLSSYSYDVLSFMSDIVLRPSFPPEELELNKQNTIEGLKFSRSDAAFLAGERVNKILYGEHPYSVTSPTPENIEAITREKLLAFHDAKFTANNATLFVVGDVESDKLLPEINKLFGEWKQGSIVNNEFTVPPTRKQRTLSVVNRPDSAQSNIIIGNVAINRTHQDYFPCVVMNQILGAGASSRLFMNIREDKGYTYGAYSGFDARRLSGSFEATAEVRNEVTGDSLKEFFYELNRIRDEKATNEELADAQSYLTGVFPLRGETQEGLTNQIVSQELNGLPQDYLQTYRDNINAVTLDEIQRVAREYVNVDSIAIVIVGDAETILEQAKDYAESVEVFDVDGNMAEVKS
jgi:zinc protease